MANCLINGNQSKLLALIGLLCWLVCFRLIFPLPAIFFGSASIEAFADLFLWLITVIMLWLGVWSSLKLYFGLALKAVVVLGVAIFIYIALRALVDRAIYGRLWSDVVTGRLPGTMELIWRVNGWGVVELMLYAVIIPTVLLWVFVKLIFKYQK